MDGTDVRDLDISLLRAFIAVVEAGGVTAAARVLNRTQAAVSQQIKRLETVLGSSLFEREHKRILLAAAGERLLGDARRLVALNDDLYATMTAERPSGRVRLGIPMDIVPTYAPAILRRFASTRPDATVQLTSRNTACLLAMLDHGDLDIALTTEFGASRVGSEQVYRDRLVWLGARNGTSHRASPLPISIGSPECRFRPVLLDALRVAGRSWRLVFEVAGQEAQLAPVAADLAVTAMLSESVPKDLQVLEACSGLPSLPICSINMYQPRRGAIGLGSELASEIRAEFAERRALVRTGASDAPTAPLKRRQRARANAQLPLKADGTAGTAPLSGSAPRRAKAPSSAGIVS